MAERFLAIRSSSASSLEFLVMSKLEFLSDAHHFAIANVAVRAAQLDHHLEYCIMVAFAPHGRTAEFALKNLGADRVVGLLRVSLCDRSPLAQDDIEQMCQKISGLRSERNSLLHWIWSSTEDNAVAKLSSLRPFREHRHKKKTAADIHKIAEDMLKMSRLLVAWTIHLGEKHKPETSQNKFVRLTPPPSWASFESEDRTIDDWRFGRPQKPSPE